MDYKILHQNTAYNGFFKIEKLKIQYDKFTGGQIEPQTREVFERGHAAAVIPYDPIRDAILWIEQFRPGALQANFNPWVIETIAGMIEPNETPEEVIIRESIEEAGCKIKNIEKISSYLVSPGGTSEVIHLFCAQADTSDIERHHGLIGEGEDIRTHVLSFAESLKWYQAGKLNSATPMLAMQWLILNRDRLRARLL